MYKVDVIPKHVSITLSGETARALRDLLGKSSKENKRKFITEDQYNILYSAWSALDDVIGVGEEEEC